VRKVGGVILVVEQRDRFARFAVAYIEASLSDQNRTLVDVDVAGLDDDLVADMTEVLTSLGAGCTRNAPRPTRPAG
jgi:predicted site-specific integrase-resolvase